MSAPKTADEPTVEEMMADLRAAAGRIAERHGESAAKTFVRLFIAFLDNQISDEEFLAFCLDVYRRGEWRPVAARLNALTAGADR